VSGAANARIGAGHSAAEEAPRRALFFGDSLVAGVGDPTGGGWVARVVAACFASGTGVTPYNLGVRRETSVQVAARFRQEALPRVATGPGPRDARAVVSFGANDTTVEDGARREPPEASRAALASILDEAAELGLPVLVVGPAPLHDVEQNARMAALGDSFAEVCARRGAPFVPVLERLQASRVWMAELAARDGAHPGAEGYEELAGLLVRAGVADWLTAR
jgi:acyl-CoA thioesterase I